MASITSQWIVDRLIEHPTNEFEAGINSAYISILKEIAPKSIPAGVSTEELNLKKCLGDVKFNLLTQSGIDELIDWKKRNNKLGFIKRIKELLGLSLIEGRDIADELWKM